MMPDDPAPPAPPGHAAQVFRAADVFVASGVNLGDDLAPPDAVCPGDGYEVDAEAKTLRLVLDPASGADAPRVARGSEVGAPGDAIAFLAGYTLMARDGELVEALILRLEAGMGAGTIYLLPLSPMARGVEYTLVGVNPAPEDTRLADLLCVSFARGTLITLATGEGRPIEALAIGDRVLTRDHGAQPVRWIGRATLRAVGSFAPVVIAAEALGNSGDLIVSQHHRMFLYRRDRKAGVPTAEVLIQAKHLLGGTLAYLREGGFVDYFSLVFDRHEIIYAEGIPAESLMVNEATIARLPEALAEEIRAQFPGLSQSQHFGTEAGREAAPDMDGEPRPARRGRPR